MATGVLEAEDVVGLAHPVMAVFAEAALAAGDEAEVTYVRNGETRTTTVTLGELVL